MGRCGTRFAFANCGKRPGYRLPLRISREHYVSQDILLECGQLAVSGFPRQPAGEVLRLGTNALAAKVVCGRHTSALSDLDSLALIAFRAIVDAPRYATSRVNPGRPMHSLVSGQALELWMVKVLAGIVAGSRRPLRGSGTIDLEAVAAACSQRALPAGADCTVSRKSGRCHSDRLPWP